MERLRLFPLLALLGCAPAFAQQQPAESASESSTSNGSVRTHTENIGMMKNFSLPRTKRLTGYTWIMGGITSLTGSPHVLNRFYDGEALGVIIHCNDHNSIWVQEMFNKIVSQPWYTTTSVGYTRSW